MPHQKQYQKGGTPGIPALILGILVLVLSVSCVSADTIQMGSYMDVTYVNVVTDLSVRDIMASGDGPAEASYSIHATGVLIETPQGSVMQPATGLISAFMDVQTPTLSYNEYTSASGYIDSFVKEMYYQDGELRY